MCSMGVWKGERERWKKRGRVCVIRNPWIAHFSDGAIEEADKNVEAQKKITSAWKMKEEELWTELGRRKQYSEAVREEICNQVMVAMVMITSIYCYNISQFPAKLPRRSIGESTV